MKIVIYGLGKSGTSALFYKVRNSLPRGTIELFEPSSFSRRQRIRTRFGALRRGHFAPHVLAKVLPCDVRPVQIGDFEDFDRKILLVRDPRDRIVSDLLYRGFNAAFVRSAARCEEFLALLRMKEAEPHAVPLLRLLERFDALETSAGTPSSWRERYHLRGVECPLRFHDERPRLPVFRYEQLVNGDFSTVEAILGLPLRGDAAVPPTLQRVSRTKSKGSWRDWFTTEDANALRPVLEPFLDRYYPKADWSLATEPRIDPQHGSSYAARVMNERRALWNLSPVAAPGPTVGGES